MNKHILQYTCYNTIKSMVICSSVAPFMLMSPAKGTGSMPSKEDVSFGGVTLYLPLTFVPWPSLLHSFPFLPIVSLLCSHYISCLAGINFTQSNVLWGSVTFVLTLMMNHFLFWPGIRRLSCPQEPIVHGHIALGLTIHGQRSRGSSCPLTGVTWAKIPH